MRSLFRSSVDYRIGFSYWFALIATGALGYFAWGMIQDLPKPETIIELGKFYFTDTSEYLKATALSLFTGLLLAALSFIGLVSAIKNDVEYSEAARWIIIVLGSIVGIVSLYFLYYGFYLLLILLLMGLVVMFLFHSGSSSTGNRK